MHLETHLPLLLDLLLKSTAVLALAAVLMVAFRRASAANRHALAVAALVTLLALPFTKLIAPRWSLALNQPASATAVTIKLPPITTMAFSESGPGAAMSVPVNAPGIRVNWSATGVGVWLAGFALALLHRAGVGLRLRRLTAESRAMKEGRVLAMAEELATACGVRAEIRESDTCRVPLAFGVWRPTVLLPTEAMGWSDERLAAALLHEFGHVRRRDCLTRWFADLACAFYWMNPLVWLGARALRLAQEQACDDVVLNAGTRPDDYATQLVEVVRSLQGDRFTARHALAMAQPSTLETRVRAIVDESRDRSARSVRGAFVGITFATTALVLCMAAQLRGANEKKGAPEAEVPTTFGPQVEIEAKFIEITGEDPALLDFLKAENPTPIPVITGIIPSAKADAALKRLEKAKGVDILSTPRVTTKSKQRAQIAIVREFIYPTEWEKDAKGAWTPSAFEMKNVGVTFDVTPEVHAGNSIDLKMTPEVVEFEGFVDLDGDVSKVVGKPDAAKPVAEGAIVKQPVAAVPEGHRAQPVFNTRKMSTQLTVWPGQTIVLGGFEGPRPRDKANADGKELRRLVVLVAARIANPDGIPVEKPAGVPANPKGKAGAVKEPKSLEIVSDTMTLDKTTGTLSASGNVKVETAQTVIKADSAEITPKKDAANAGDVKADAKWILPKVDFRDSTLREVVDFLVARSKTLDAAGKGVNIVLRNAERIGDVKITLGLTHVPLTEVLRYVASLANCEVVKEEFAFVIGPAAAAKPAPSNKNGVSTEKNTRNGTEDRVQVTGRPLDASKPLEELVTKQWKAQPEIFKGGPAHQILMQRGIVFGQGAFAMFSPESNVLLVRNTPAQLALVEQILGQALAAPAVPPLPKDAPGAVRKENAIIIPNVDFQNATLAEAVDFLRMKSKELDPQKTGVNFILEPAVGGTAPKITLRLKDVPLIEVIKYISNLADYSVKFEDHAITLAPMRK